MTAAELYPLLLFFAVLIAAVSLVVLLSTIYGDPGEPDDDPNGELLEEWVTGLRRAGCVRGDEP